MRERNMNQGRKSEMLRSTGKNGQKRNISGPFDVADASDARQGGNDSITGGKDASLLASNGKNALTGADEADHLTGGTAVAGTANVWKQESNGQTFWYLLTDWTENGQTFQRLSIEGPDGGVFVKAWSAGQLGITLPGAQAETPAPAVLVGTAGTDKLHAQHDEAVITGNGGADLLEAGSVGTALYADEVIPDLTQYVADTANLTGGGTLAPGGAQTGSVLIGSHGGDDTLVGGTGNDALFGAFGRDQLIGGGGADFILGDGRFNPTSNPGDGTYIGWQLAAPPGDFVIAGFGFTEALYSADHPANDDADIIHGGGGNDMAWGGFGDDLIYGEGGDGEGQGECFRRNDKAIYQFSEMLRSTGKNGQKRNASGAANDDFREMAA